MTEPAAEYTIAELRDHLRDAIEATHRGPVLITRRGRTVARLVAPDAKLEPEHDWFEATMAWRRRMEAEGLLVDDGIFDDVRDRTDVGREVDLS